MSLRRMPWKDSTDQRVYAGTGKDAADHPKGPLYRIFADMIDETFPGGATTAEVYHTLGTRMRLTQDDIRELLRSATQAGYLEYIRG